MSWVDDTLVAFKAWLGDTTATDAQLTTALTLSLATVETYLDRPLELMQRTQEDWPTDGMIRLRAWPVDNVGSVTANDDPLELTYITLDKRTGRLAVPGACGMTVTTTYSGGFDPMPLDLEHALWMVAAGLLPTVVSADGAASFGETAKRVSVPDVGTIEYGSAVGGSAASSASLLGGALPPQIDAILSRYRAESIVGGA